MNEIYIREKLIKALAKQHPSNTEFLAELPIANFSRRIDLVMANGSLSGFEIKSEQDSLKRLGGQLETYMQYFENVTVVCATKHLQGVMNIASKNVGIWEFDGKKIIKHRNAIKNQLTKQKWLSFLNIIGLKAILRENKIKVSGLKSELIKRAMILPLDKIKLFILDYLKQQFPLMEKHRQDRQERKLSITNKASSSVINEKMDEPQALSSAEIYRRKKIKMIRQAHHERMFAIFGDTYEYLP